MFVRLNDLMTAKVRYLFKKSNSPTFYYRRKIPDSLRPYYNHKQHLLISLKTSNEREAVRLLQKQHSIIESQFKALSAPSTTYEEAARLLKSFNLLPIPKDHQTLHYEEDISQYEVFMMHLEQRSDSPDDLTGAERLAFELLTDSTKPKLEEGLSLLLQSPNLTKKKSQEYTRYVSYFIDTLPTTELDRIRTMHVEDAVKALHPRYKSDTIKKYIQSARKAFRLVARRYELQRANPFEGLEHKTGHDQQSRITFSTEQLNLLSDLIRSKYKEVQSVQILGLLFNTGCRCSEIGGLPLSDIVLNHPTPHVRVRPTDKKDTKTKSSVRSVPLVGLSLSVAEHLVSTATPSQKYAFPRYCKNERFAYESCNAAVNKMLKTVIPEGTSYGFRNALTDRLIESGSNDTYTKTLMGWSKESMLDVYGVTEALGMTSKVMHNMLEFERGTIDSDII